jgi:DNA-directed RNA polymerase beta subunit
VEYPLVMLTYATIFNQVKAAFQQPTAPLPSNESSDDVSVTPDVLMAVTHKLLAVNRGHAEPDERDSLAFRRVHTPDKLFAERVTLDAGKLRRVAMRRIAKQRNLKAIGPSHFDPYMQGMIIGNPLSSPIEEINPISLVEQSRRITQMGPGGIPSSDSVTAEAQSVHPSIFGFLDCISGPESERIGVDTRLAWGAKIGSDGKIYQKMLNRRTGKHQYVSPEDLENKVIGLPK